MERSDIQKLWDETLLKGWHKNWSTGYTVHYYAKMLNLMSLVDIRKKLIRMEFYLKDFLSLKLLRAPDDYIIKGIPIRAWVAERMPWLNNTLWNEKLSDEKIIKKMEESNYKCEEKHGQGFQQYLRRQTKITSSRHWTPNDEKHLRSGQWGTTKPVRSK